MTPQYGYTWIDLEQLRKDRFWEMVSMLAAVGMAGVSIILLIVLWFFL